VVLNKIPDIKTGGIIFCRGKYLFELFDKIKNIDAKFILITNMCDVNLGKEIYDRKPDNIISWFSDNVDVEGVNILPLGLPATIRGEKNSSSDNIKTVLSEKLKDNNLCYYGMNEHKNNERNNMFNQVKDFSLVTSKISQIAYYRNISQSKFVCCPEGYGLDTWRFFETLYMG
jgi:hypothetical protein